MLRLSAYDVFRKLPRDLTHGTTHGGVLSVVAILVIFVVFLLELSTYLTGEVETEVMLDTNRQSNLQINFRITMVQLPCEYASVDVWDYLGNNRLDLKQNIHKTMVAGPLGQKILGAYSDGSAASSGDNPVEARAQIGMDESESLMGKDFEAELAKNSWSFIDFYAPWCIHWYAIFTLIHTRARGRAGGRWLTVVQRAIGADMGGICENCA